jgi:hypothetical protein
LEASETPCAQAGRRIAGLDQRTGRRRITAARNIACDSLHNSRLFDVYQAMKESTHVVRGLIGLVLLLFAYGVFITVGAVRLEKSLNRGEAACQELQVKHRILADTFAHVEASPELTRALVTALARESRAHPTDTYRDVRLIGTELNSPPEGVTPK